MSTSAVCESMERRDLFAAAPVRGLDSDFVFDFAAVLDVAGPKTRIYEAIPAAGDRTYLLAERYDERRVARGDVSNGYLTIARITADGKLDASFGTNGVALTQRVTQSRGSPDGEAPGLLKPDGRGGLYFADNSRVLRFRPNGTIDRAFARRGEAVINRGDKALTDIAPAGDGVFVSTTNTIAGVQHFSVQFVDTRVSTVFFDSHDTGVARVNVDGYDDDADRFGFQAGHFRAPQAARFAQSRGGLIWARVETDYKEIPYDAFNGDLAVVRTVMKVTRINADATGGVDLARASMRKGSYQSVGIAGTRLSPNGRVLLAQTDTEVLRFDLTTGVSRRHALPGEYADSTSHQLLPDGRLWAATPGIGRVDYRQFTLQKLAVDGTRDTAFGDNGVLTLRLNKKADDKNYLAVTQLFLGASGRPYVVVSGFYGAPTTLQRL